MNGLGLVRLIATGLNLSSGMFQNKVNRGNSFPYYHLAEGEFTVITLVVYIKKFAINYEFR